MLLAESAFMLTALALAFVSPGVGSQFFVPIERGLLRLAQRRRTSILVCAAVALGLRAVALPILPIPYPVFQDEFSYLLMADTFAHGRLTNPPHPLWTHFETIMVIHRPTYCSIYYPAQGLFLALGQVVLKHPFWGVWLSVGVMCAAICWMLQAFVPPVWALVGGLLAAVRLGAFSYWANSYWGGAVAALGGALLLGAWPRIKRSQRLRDSLLMGLGFAILATSRPYEGFFFSIPILGALIFWIFRRRAKLWLCLSRVVVPCSIPLAVTFAFMLYYFWRTTGHPLLSPYVISMRTYAIDPPFPWLPLRTEPQYHVAMLRDYFHGFDLHQYEFARTHFFLAAAVKLVMYWFFYLGPLLTLPFLALGFALPYGTSFKDLRPNARFLLLVCAVTAVGLLLPVYSNPHYAAPLTAVIYAFVVMALQRLRKWKTGNKSPGIFVVRSVGMGAVLLLILRIAISVFHLPLTNSAAPITWCSPWNQLYPRAEIERRLEALPGKQLILVHYGPEHDASASWVNNRADIDGSKIVWAHDMGSVENAELMHYFSDRDVWLLDPKQHDIEVTPYRAADSPQGATTANEANR